MHWLAAVERLRRERRTGVLVTLVSVRGHAPREAGAKMVVTADDAWDSIGGGNLEATAVARARTMLSEETATPEQISLSLNDKARAEHGQQCCGGEVVILLEPLAVAPSVAIFGMGHVGLELARILARHDVELHLVDSRADHVTEQRLAVLDDAVARVHVHHAPVPELVLGQVPRGTHVLVMTHDHAEDAALCDTALRCGHLASIGLIGSSAKWSRFRQRLAAEGHSPETLARITTPIGLPDLVVGGGKDPATIAVSVAADLLRVFGAERARAATTAEPSRSSESTESVGAER
ncbi:xanthine dehydrogenase accessory protein XdhC [Pedococcus aerophilus]|uniref:Xanthine dehydrogenase accessory protein XdhC n=1 Tax=Pedococcus aerophilus TaxID=436356 RepID=A0ABN3ULV6_9MICO